MTHQSQFDLTSNTAKLKIQPKLNATIFEFDKIHKLISSFIFMIFILHFSALRLLSHTDICVFLLFCFSLCFCWQKNSVNYVKNISQPQCFAPFSLCTIFKYIASLLVKLEKKSKSCNMKATCNYQILNQNILSSKYLIECNKWQQNIIS